MDVPPARRPPAGRRVQECPTTPSSRRTASRSSSPRRSSRSSRWSTSPRARSSGATARRAHPGAGPTIVEPRRRAGAARRPRPHRRHQELPDPAAHGQPQAAPATQVPTHVYGTTTQACHHDPPTHFGSPNGAFPMTNGHYLVTEINGDWVDEMDLAGTIYGSWHPPGVAYPSDSNEIAPGQVPDRRLLVARADRDLRRVGQPAVALRARPARPRSTTRRWPCPCPTATSSATTTTTTGSSSSTRRRTRSSGSTGCAGSPAPPRDYLNGVDGLDLAPPYSDLVVHAKTMGLPPRASPDRARAPGPAQAPAPAAERAPVARAPVARAPVARAPVAARRRSIRRG